MKVGLYLASERRNQFLVGEKHILHGEGTGSVEAVLPSIKKKKRTPISIRITKKGKKGIAFQRLGRTGGKPSEKFLRVWEGGRH